MTKQYIFLDGEYVSKEDAKVSVYDHGFLYGDGVFEGIRIYGGNVFRLKEHLKRLYESAESILLDIPYSLEEMIEITCETVRKNELQNGYIRLIVSRGAGDLGLNPFVCKKPSVIVIAEQISIFPKETYETGLQMVSVSVRRNRPDVLNPKIKSLNYLNNILARVEAGLSNADEALILNDQGYVAEGSGDNIFLVKNGVITTPPGYIGALLGITRNTIIEIAKELGYEVKEEPFTQHDVYVADEVFLTGTAAEVISVIKVDSRTIGKGVPGEITKVLLEKFREKVLQDGVSVYTSENVK